MSRGLVVSGGATKGAYAVGFIKHLFDHFQGYQDYGVFVGTSTGALITPLVAVKRLDLLLNTYTTVTNDDIYKVRRISHRNLTKTPSLIITTPLKNLIKDVYDDNICQEILNGGHKIHIVTTCLQTKKPTLFSSPAAVLPSSQFYDQYILQSNDHIRRALLASSNQPIIMEPEAVNEKTHSGGPIEKHQYVDGGVVEYTGIETALASNHDEIMAIVLSSDKKPAKERQYNTALSALGRTFGILTSDVSSNDIRVPGLLNGAWSYVESIKSELRNTGMSYSEIDRIFNVHHMKSLFNKKPVDIKIIRPSAPLDAPIGGLFFNPRLMNNMLVLGESDAQQYATDEGLVPIVPPPGPS